MISLSWGSPSIGTSCPERWWHPIRADTQGQARWALSTDGAEDVPIYCREWDQISFKGPTQMILWSTLINSRRNNSFGGVQSASYFKEKKKQKKPTSLQSSSQGEVQSTAFFLLQLHEIIPHSDSAPTFALGNHPALTNHNWYFQPPKSTPDTAPSQQQCSGDAHCHMWESGLQGAHCMSRFSWYKRSASPSLCWGLVHIPRHPARCLSPRKALARPNTP